jgi:hypothetical protein
MAVFLLLLAIVGGVVVGDLVWENTIAGELTVFDQPVTGYPQGWLLGMAAVLGFVVALLLVASLNSTKGRRARRRQLRSIKRARRDQATGSEREHASWLDESFGGAQAVDKVGEPVGHPAEPLYEQTRQVVRLRDDSDGGFPPGHDAEGSPRRS